MRYFVLFVILTFACIFGEAKTRTPANIKTPNNSFVTGAYYITDVPAYDSTLIAALANYLSSTYNGAELIGVPSEKYNCHGYAWHMTEGGDTVWIGDSSGTCEDIYWLDGSYIEVSEVDATKVSYAGDHSAVRLNSTWYQSKWGGFALVKHHPGDVLPNYQPELPKKYYVRCPSIQGPHSPCGTETYTIENLPNNAIVYWSFLSGSIYNNALLESNQPFSGQCTININNNENINDTLVASIYGNGGLICRLKKEIVTGWNFSGSYTMTGNSPLYRNIYDEPIRNKSQIKVFPGYMVTITSSSFPYVVLSHSPSSSISWSYGGDDNISLTVSPIVKNNHTMTIYGRSNIECDNFVLTLKVFRRIVAPILNMMQDNILNITLDEESVDESLKTNGFLWRLDVRNVTTGGCVYSQNTDRKHIEIDASGWSSGVYLVRSVIGGEVFTQKIAITNK